MDLYGNKDLLSRQLVAFFASRNSPPEALDKAIEWAQNISRSDKVVISGFHSPIERVVCDILLANNRPIVMTLGRAHYKRIPPHLRTSFANGNILFISFSNLCRANLSSSQLRNWATTDLAVEIVFAPFRPESQLSTLLHFLHHTSLAIRVL